MTTTREKILAVLSGYEERPAGTYRLNSPLRAGANSHSFVLKIDDDEHGAYYDHVSSESGSLYELAEKLGIEVERRQIADTKRTYTGLDDYATAHGIEGAVLAAAGWVDAGKVRDWNDGKEVYRHALKFPTKSGERYRFIDGESELPSYKPLQTGYKSCWYGLDKAIGIAQKTNQPLVICNGEISTITAQHYGVAACAITNGEKQLPPELLTELQSKWTGKVILTPDCDNTGRKTAKAIKEQVANAVIVDLGLTDKGDLADFCRLYTNDAVGEIAKRSTRIVPESVADLNSLATAIHGLAIAIKDPKPEQTLEDTLDAAQKQIDAVRTKSAPARSLSFAELAERNLARLDDVRANPGYRGLLSHIPALDKAVGSFVGSRIHMLYGATNMGKSTLAVSLIREFAKQGAGYTVTTEMPPHAWQDKLIACMMRTPYDQIEDGLLNDWEYGEYKRHALWLAKQNCHVHDKVSPTMQEIGTAVRRGKEEYGYKWVLIDSINRLSAPGESGIYDRTTSVANSLQELALDTGLTFIVTSQVGRQIRDRSNKTPLPEDAYGSGSVEQNADVIISLYNHNHYVELGSAEPDVNFPENSALARVVKHRWRQARNVGVMLSLVGGAGFYEMDTINMNNPDPEVLKKYNRQVDIDFMGGD